MNPAQVFVLQGMRVPSNDGPGGKPTMTPDEAAHYCQGLPDHWYMAAMMKWAGDISKLQKLENLLCGEGLGIAKREGWYDGGYDCFTMVRRLAELALWETLEPYRFTAEAAGELRAGFMQVESGDWAGKWKGRYETVYGALNEWSNEAYRYVERQMADDGVLED